MRNSLFLRSRDPRPSRYAAHETGGVARNVQHPLSYSPFSAYNKNQKENDGIPGFAGFRNGGI